MFLTKKRKYIVIGAICMNFNLFLFDFQTILAVKINQLIAD